MERLPGELRIGVGEWLLMEDLLVLRQVSQAWHKAASECLRRIVRLLPAGEHFAARDHVGQLILRLYRLGRGLRRAFSLLPYIATNPV